MTGSIKAITLGLAAAGLLCSSSWAESGNSGSERVRFSLIATMPDPDRGDRRAAGLETPEMVRVTSRRGILELVSFLDRQIPANLIVSNELSAPAGEPMEFTTATEEAFITVAEAEGTAPRGRSQRRTIQQGTITGHVSARLTPTDYGYMLSLDVDSPFMPQIGVYGDPSYEPVALISRFKTMWETPAAIDPEDRVWIGRTMLTLNEELFELIGVIEMLDRPEPEIVEAIEADAPPWMFTPFENMEGTELTLESLAKGHKAILVVNTASECGYTRQYEDLQAIYSEYAPHGLEILAFPSNDFGGQEPGTHEEIAEFCSANFGVTFPLMAKVPTKGPGKCPLFHELTAGSSVFPGEIAWNFEKFLIAADGRMIARWKSVVQPTSPEMRGEIETLLGLEE